MIVEYVHIYFFHRISGRKLRRLSEIIINEVYYLANKCMHNELK